MVKKKPNVSLKNETGLVVQISNLVSVVTVKKRDVDVMRRRAKRKPLLKHWKATLIDTVRKKERFVSKNDNESMLNHVVTSPLKN